MKKLALLITLLLMLSACAPAAPAGFVPQSSELPPVSSESAPVTQEAAVSLPVYERLAKGPSQGTYYEIFVRSFADSDGDGIGDFNGLTSRLDYISGLGITGIWLMPCFTSPSYHGYDVSDYYAINPDYGTMEDFDHFLTEAEKRGIDVILDLVVNHSSSEHPWFKASRDADSPYRSWYRWTDTGEGYNLTASFFGNKIWNSDAGSYYAGLFWNGMPDLNFDSAELRQEVKNIAKFWLDKGVAGFRLDAAMYIYTAAEMGLDERAPTELSLEWWREFADYCRSLKPDCYIVGEVWDAPATRVPYAAELGSVFHFDMGETLARSIVGGSNKGNAFANSMKAEYDRLAEASADAIDALFLSNHDQTRICTALGNKPENLKMAASVYLTMQGLPFVYYGEELGMMGGKPDENIRTPFLWGDDDPELCTWVDSAHNKKVARYPEQDADPNSLLNHYRRVISLRAATPALFAGVLEPVEQPNDAVMSYTMTAPEQKVLVLHNLSTEAQTVSLNGEGEILFVTTTEGFSANGQSIVMPPKCSAVILK